MRNPVPQLFELLRRLMVREADRARPAGRAPHRPVPGPRRILLTRTAPPFAPGYFPPLRSAPAPSSARARRSSTSAGSG
jgi:hypothetical protein